MYFFSIFQVLRLQAKLSGEQEPSKIQRLNSIPCQCDTNSSSSSNSQTEQIVRELLRDMVDDAVNRASSVTSASQSRQRYVLLCDLSNLAHLNFPRFEISLLWQYWSKFGIFTEVRHFQ